MLQRLHYSMHTINPYKTQDDLSLRDIVHYIRGELPNTWQCDSRKDPDAGKLIPRILCKLLNFA